jgi:hypothetical protein
MPVGDSGTAPDAGPFTPFSDEATFSCGAIPGMEGFAPGTPVDYLEIRVYDQYSSAAVTPVPGPQSIGTPCSSPTCRDTLTHLSLHNGWYAADSCASDYKVSYFVYSRGETAATVGPSGVASFLAPIDSITEAALVLLAQKSIPLICHDTPANAGWRKNADGSFEIITVFGGSCGQKKRGRYRVDTNGALTVVQEDQARP